MDYKNQIKILEHKAVFDSNEDYHGEQDHISSSPLKLYMKSPRHYYASKKGWLKKETKGFTFGTIAHTYFLEHEEVAEKFISTDEMPYPDKDFRNTANKEWKAEQIEAGKTVVTKSDFTSLESIRDQVEESETAMKLLFAPGRVCEMSHYVTAYFEDIGETLKVKIRPDIMVDLGPFGLVNDLKTCKSAEPWEFEKDAEKYGYAMSLEFYCMILSAIYGKPFIPYITAVESAAPWNVQVYDLNTEDERTRAYYFLMQCLQKHARCLQDNKWEGYSAFLEDPNGVAKLKCPTWARQEINFN